MLELITNPAAWASLATLALLEIILGVDNIIFLSIVTSRLPKQQQPRARKIGLMIALVGRILLLLTLSWIIGLTIPIFEISSIEISWRDIILFVGGLFLIYKASAEIYQMLACRDNNQGKPGAAMFAYVLAQIFLLDLVFSLDSVLTAIGVAEHIEIMITAIVIAIGVMMIAAEPISAFVQKHSTVKMLALSFLVLVGITLVADAMDLHIPRGFLYLSIAFATSVEILNLIVRHRVIKKTAKVP
jgi:predicted tellurium resistance membrane protein TerC|tara:strand:- start:2317 stop:3048 length:732 start_codon:yes stop_codon:yes gene_type:complete